MLGYVNYNSTVLIGNTTLYDDFGIATKPDLVEFKCYIRESENLEPITAVDGSQFIITYYVTIEGDCRANVGDMIVINGQTMLIRSKKYIRDFDLNIISTKFGV